jgi:Ni,Fe-hydrogenase III large subunit
MAQSVSTATWVPCFVDVPPGWSFAGLQAGQGSAETWLDSDREGTKAVDVRLAPSCDTSGATAAPSGHPGTSRYDRMVTLDPALEFRRTYVFQGGCVTITLTLGGEEHSEAVALATTGIDLVPRRDLQQQVREQTGGRLTLDPEEAP